MNTRILFAIVIVAVFASTFPTVVFADQTTWDARVKTILVDDIDPVTAGNQPGYKIQPMAKISGNADVKHVFKFRWPGRTKTEFVEREVVSGQEIVLVGQELTISTAKVYLDGKLLINTVSEESSSTVRTHYFVFKK
jgi:hypothetical protein